MGKTVRPHPYTHIHNDACWIYKSQYINNTASEISNRMKNCQTLNKNLTSWFKADLLAVIASLRTCTNCRRREVKMNHAHFNRCPPPLSMPEALASPHTPPAWIPLCFTEHFFSMSFWFVVLLSIPCIVFSPQGFVLPSLPRKNPQFPSR